MSAFCLGSDEIDAHWQQIEPHLRRLERCGHCDVDELREELRDARKQLWGYQDGAGDGRVLGVAVTRIAGKTTPVCEIFGAAGTQSNPGQIHELYAHIEQWARSIGCVKIRLQGRRGWQRLLSGFEQVGIILEKEF